MKLCLNRTALIVDDSLYMRMLIKKSLQKIGCRIVGEAGSGEAAIRLAVEYQPDLITLDNILPDMYGIGVLKILRNMHINSKIVMISAVGQQAFVGKGLSMGASYYIVKPFTPEVLIDTVKKTFIGDPSN